ncbi:hypothetical protein PTQ24_000123 [Salmonella phage KKP_3822]|uniref:Uncharacterized protein n=1 Tax=Salmonella phage KKP_3822 TaxID=3027681 RepID=A0AAX4ND03_9CAUD
MADNLKLKVDKQKKCVEVELGEERLKLSFEVSSAVGYDSNV